MRRPRPAELECVLCFEFPIIRDFSKPSVTLHKSGRYLLFKPNDSTAADVLRELDDRMSTGEMRTGQYFGVPDTQVLRDWTPETGMRRIELWKHLAGDITRHPYCRLLKSFGVEIGTSPSLEGYIRREFRRRTLENTPYTAIQVNNNDVTLFERASVGTNLLCTEDFTPPGDDAPLFEQGKRYMVVRMGGDGVDKIAICTNEVTHNAEIPLAGEGAIYEWSALDSPMEEYFDDSETIDFGEDIRQKYPARIAEMEARVAKLPFIVNALAKDGKSPLYEHVRLDAVEEALKRGVVNCKLMRMGKTSEAITVVELRGSTRVAVIGSKNVRLAWRREGKRLGFKDEDFVMVNRLQDLEKTGKYFLMTYDWIKSQDDPTASARKIRANYLHAAEYTRTRKVTWSKDPEPITVYDTNPCPHCGDPLERAVLRRDGTGKHVETVWTTAKGYLCRNPKCTQKVKDLKTWARPGEGAAWTVKKPLQHAGGAFVDYGLASHVDCPEGSVRGRQCMVCGTTDGAWTPPRYRRIKDSFTAVVGDEIHNAKEISSQNAQAMYALRSRFRMAMTGTLLSNSPLDAYWPLHWAIGGPRDGFPYLHQAGKKAFQSRFCDFVYLEKPTGEVDEETGEQVMKTVRKQTPFLVNPPDWWRAMQPKIKRRNYSDPLFVSSLVEAGMSQPTPEMLRVKCPMHPKQARLMLDALRDFKTQYEQLKAQAESKNLEINPAMIIAKMTSLRKIATVPERLNQEFQAKTQSDLLVYEGPTGGGKMATIVDLVNQSVAAGKKILILSDFLLMQLNCEKAVAHHNPIRLVTAWGDDRRDEAVTDFMTNPDRKVFIAGTRAVRESIDLSCADVTICTDLLWSPAYQCQAWSRTMAPTPRQRTCTVYVLVSTNSLDEHIYTVFYSKAIAAEQAMDRKVMNRRALDFDVKFFAERVLEEEAALTLQLRDVGDEEVGVAQTIDFSTWEERG